MTFSEKNNKNAEKNQSFAGFLQKNQRFFKNPRKGEKIRFFSKNSEFCQLWPPCISRCEFELTNRKLGMIEYQQRKLSNALANSSLVELCRSNLLLL